MVQVELRDKTSIFFVFSASKRSSAESGVKRTFAGSPSVAAAKARQKSTSKPDQAPLASALENPGTPWLTPQISASRWRTSSSVPAKAEESPAAAKPTRASAKIRRLDRMAECSLMLEARRLLDDDARPDRHAVIEVDDVVVDQAEAARRDGVADRIGLVRPVDAIDGLAEIQRTGAQGIAGTAGHEARQIRLALDHLRWRTPVGPFLLAGDFLQSRPLEPVASNADAVADRPIVALDEIEKTLGRNDDHRARRLVRSVEDNLLLERPAELLLLRRRLDARLVLDVHVDLGRRLDDRLGLRGRGGGES